MRFLKQLAAIAVFVGLTLVGFLLAGYADFKKWGEISVAGFMFGGMAVGIVGLWIGLDLADGKTLGQVVRGMATALMAFPEKLVRALTGLAGMMGCLLVIVIAGIALYAAFSALPSAPWWAVVIIVLLVLLLLK
ncbi:MAG: hypothetical protein ACREYF_16810 [Gammaproteobacteria bacterium]